MPCRRRHAQRDSGSLHRRTREPAHAAAPAARPTPHEAARGASPQASPTARPAAAPQQPPGRPHHHHHRQSNSHRNDQQQRLHSIAAGSGLRPPPARVPPSAAQGGMLQESPSKGPSPAAMPAARHMQRQLSLGSSAGSMHGGGPGRAALPALTGAVPVPSAAPQAQLAGGPPSPSSGSHARPLQPLPQASQGSPWSSSPSQRAAFRGSSVYYGDAPQPHSQPRRHLNSADGGPPQHPHPHQQHLLRGSPQDFGARQHSPPLQPRSSAPGALGALALPHALPPLQHQPVPLAPADPAGPLAASPPLPGRADRLPGTASLDRVPSGPAQHRPPRPEPLPNRPSLGMPSPAATAAQPRLRPLHTSKSLPSPSRREALLVLQQQQSAADPGTGQDEGGQGRAQRSQELLCPHPRKALGHCPSWPSFLQRCASASIPRVVATMHHRHPMLTTTTARRPCHASHRVAGAPQLPSAWGGADAAAAADAAQPAGPMAEDTGTSPGQQQRRTSARASRASSAAASRGGSASGGGSGSASLTGSPICSPVGSPIGSPVGSPRFDLTIRGGVAADEIAAAAAAAAASLGLHFTDSIKLSARRPQHWGFGRRTSPDAGAEQSPSESRESTPKLFTGVPASRLRPLAHERAADADGAAEAGLTSGGSSTSPTHHHTSGGPAAAHPGDDPWEQLAAGPGPGSSDTPPRDIASPLASWQRASSSSGSARAPAPPWSLEPCLPPGASSPAPLPGAATQFAGFLTGLPSQPPGLAPSGRPGSEGSRPSTARLGRHAR